MLSPGPRLNSLPGPGLHCAEPWAQQCAAEHNSEKCNVRHVHRGRRPRCQPDGKNMYLFIFCTNVTEMHTRTYSMHSSRLRGQFAITTVQVNFERTQKTLTVYKWNQMNPLWSIWCRVHTVRVTDLRGSMYHLKRTQRVPGIDFENQWLV